MMTLAGFVIEIARAARRQSRPVWRVEWALAKDGGVGLLFWFRDESENT